MSRALRVPTDSALATILDAGEPVAMAFAAELQSIADQADRNAIGFAAMPDDKDHGGVGSASACSRVFATSLRWRAQQILDEAAKRSTACNLRSDCPATAGHLFDCVSLDGSPFDAQRKALVGPRPVA